MRRILAIILFLIFSLSEISFALDWKNLHEKADNEDLKTIRAKVLNNPNSIENLYVLGLVYFNLYKDSEALEVFSDILKRDPKVIEAKWGVAESLRRKHDLDKSEILLNEVIKSNSEFSPAYISLAYIKYIRLDFESSVKLALKVIEQGQSNMDLTNYVRAIVMYAGAKGMIAHYGGVFSKAVNGLSVKPNLDKAEKLQPNSSTVLFGLGSFYLLAPAIAGGDKNKAEEYFLKAIKVDPLFADVYVRLAQLYKAQKDNLKYEFYLQKATEIDPKSERLLDYNSGKCKYICADKES